jgi:hypothetical protein
VYQALKAMEFSAKSSLLASDQGLQELTENYPNNTNKLKSKICASLMVACILFSTTVAIMFLADVKDTSVKAGISVSVFFVTLLICLVYVLVISKKNRMLLAVEELSVAF